MLKFYLKSRDSLSHVLELVYPIGSVYINASDNTDPSTLLGFGTWERVGQGRVMIDADSTYAAGSTGGSATHTHTTGDCTLTAAQSGVPAHSHGLNSHKHSVGAHAHGLNSHTHTYDKAKTPTGSTTLTAAQSGLPAHTHTAKIMYSSNPGVSGDIIKVESGSGIDYSYTTSNTVGWNKGFPNVVNTAAAASQGHTHTNSYTSTASGAASGNTANSTAFDSGAASGDTTNNTAAAATSAHNHGATGSGSTIQPWVGVYMWKRTA